jgi:hypothetical protein
MFGGIPFEHFAGGGMPGGGMPRGGGDVDTTKLCKSHFDTRIIPYCVCSCRVQ